MKKLFLLGFLSIVFTQAKIECEARLDSQGKDYWTVTFKKIDQEKFPDVKEYGPVCLSSHKPFSIYLEDSVCISPGQTKKVHRKSFRFLLQGWYTKKFKTFSGGKRIKLSKNFRTKKHHITIELRENSWPFGVSPTYRITTKR